MYAGRLTYNFLNPEKNPGYYTSGTYFGTAGDILALASRGELSEAMAPVHLPHRSDYDHFCHRPSV